MLWYVAYGSNMLAARLGYYLAGGTPPGARRTYPGCRNCGPPRRSSAVTLPGGIFFALESTTWGGGMAFYDPALPGEAAARAHLITAEQFADLAAQEMHGEIGTDIDVDAVVRAGRLTLGDGRYETMLHVGDRDGHPMITFTAPWTAAEARLNRPAPHYLRLIADGLREGHGWDDATIAAYLARAPGNGVAVPRPRRRASLRPSG